MPLSADEKKEVMQYEEEQKREWNKLILSHIAKLRKINKPSPQFPNSVERACQEYFDLCLEDGVKPSIAGLSLALGTNRTTLLSWVNGDISIECADVVKTYFGLLEVFDETALKDNRINAVAGVFNAKNNYNYKDQVEHKIIEDRELSNEEIERRYRLMHEIVSEQIPQKQEPIPLAKPKPTKQKKIKEPIKEEKQVAKQESSDDDIVVPF